MRYEDIETNILSNGDSSEATPNDSSLDYDTLYDTIYYATYNALDDYCKFNDVSKDISIASGSDALQYATSTDARLYTVSVASAPTSSAQATEAYLLDTRNILIIFALAWFSITLYSKIKNLIINYTKE